jgi:hypothetical protein
LLAVAAVNIPWLTCQSACQDGSRALWVFVDHHCHSDACHSDACHSGACDADTPSAEPAAAPHVHEDGHPCHCPHDAGTDAQTGPNGPGSPEGPAHPDEPGDHEVRYHPVVRSDSPVLVAAPVLVAPAQTWRWLSGIDDCVAAIRTPVFGTGPPPDLASVRLLL